jgi:hypothetical protein
MRQIDFTDGYETSEAPAAGNINLAELTSFANDAAFIADLATRSVSLSDGMMYFNTSDSRVHVYTGSAWTSLAIRTGDTLTTPTISNPTVSSGTFTNASLVNPTIDTQTTTGTSLLADIQAIGPVQIGNPTHIAANSKAVLELISTTKGFLPPRMTGTERDAISSPTTGLLVYNTSTNKMNVYNGSSWVEVGSSGAGGINYIQSNAGNPDAENDVSGWITYDDAAATPVDGTGGTVNGTLTRTTSSPLRGNASFLWTPNTSGIGEGASYAFTIDSTDKAKQLSISFDYALSGTITEGDYTVWIYDVTNSQIIQPAGYKLAGTSGTNYTFKGTFQTASNSTSYRLLIHQTVNNPGSGAITLKFDNVSVGPQSVTYTTPMSDWKSFTQSWLSTGTQPALGNGSAFGWYRRVGDSVEVMSALIFGSTTTYGTATYLFPLPETWMTIDSTKVNATQTSQSFGHASAASGNYVGDVMQSSANLNQLLIRGPSAVASWNPTTPKTFANGDTISLHYVVPITGWSSSAAISQSDSTEGRPVAMFAEAASVSYPGASSTIVIGTKIFDSHGGYNTSTGLYTVSVPGYYEISGQLAVTHSATTGQYITLAAIKNGSALYYQVTRLVASTVSANAILSPTLVVANAGDTLGFQVNIANGTSLGSQADPSWLAIKRVGGSQSITSGETVAARYKTSAGQSISNSGSTIVDFGTSDYSTHGAVTTGASWKFTAPTRGKYSVKATLLFQSGTYASGNSIELYLFKNGSSFSTLSTLKITAAVTDNFGIQGSDEVQLNAGDTIDIRALNNRTAGATSLFASTDYNHISITRLGN